jgi:hypothetical protein
MKYWVKTYKGEKLLKNKVVQPDVKLTRANFSTLIREISLELDEPTPIVVDSQYNNFCEFNVVRFKASDYVESVPFDKMTIEVISEDK